MKNLINKKIVYWLMASFCFLTIYVSKVKADNFAFALESQHSIGDDGQPDAGKRASASTSVVVDQSGNIYTSGFYEQDLDIDPDPNNVLLLPDNGENSYLAKFTSSGDLIWAKKISALDGCYIMSIALDSQGNIIMTGYFYGTCDFDPGPGVFQLTTPDHQAFVAKYTQNGNFVWAKKVESQEDIRCLAYNVAVDKNDSVLVTGEFESPQFGMTQFDFDPGVGQFFLSGSFGNNVCFIWKLNSNGNFVWAKKVGGDDKMARGQDIATDSQNNVFVIGEFEGQIDFDPGAGEQFKDSGGGNEDVFILKLNSQGNYVNCIHLQGTEKDAGRAIAIDSGNNIIVGGYFTQELQISQNPNDNLVGVWNNDAYVIKYNNNLDLIWGKAFTGPMNVRVTDIALDPKVVSNPGANDILVTGYFQDLADFDPSQNQWQLQNYDNNFPDTFVVKLSGSGGNLMHARQFTGGNVYSSFNPSRVAVSAVDSSVLVADQISSTTDFDTDMGLFTLEPYNFDEPKATLAKLNHQLLYRASSYKSGGNDTYSDILFRNSF